MENLSERLLAVFCFALVGCFIANDTLRLTCSFSNSFIMNSIPLARCTCVDAACRLEGRGSVPNTKSVTHNPSGPTVLFTE